MENKLKKPVNIVCFYWNGTDRPGWDSIDLGFEYILKLYNGFKRNTTIPFKFHCLLGCSDWFGSLKRIDDTDAYDGIIFHKLESPSWLGCLPKYSMFNPIYGFSGRVFACDLDASIYIYIVSCCFCLFAFKQQH